MSRGLVGVDHPDDDFATYMAARWPDLVRTLVSLGCAAHEAEDVAQDALTRCYRSWDRVRRADDVDAYVYRTLLNVWAKSRRRRWWGEQPSEAPLDHLPPGGATSEPLDARLDLVAELARLSLDHRTVLVLRFAADLTEAQTAAVLGVPVGTVKSRVSRALAAIDTDHLREETR